MGSSLIQCSNSRRRPSDFDLQETELSPRELAVTFTDQGRYFVSESTVYRVLKAQDLITSPAFIVIKVANEFKDKTTGVNQLWQTDFTYIKALGWGLTCAQVSSTFRRDLGCLALAPNLGRPWSRGFRLSSDRRAGFTV